MKILHVVKSTEGGDWAAREVTELVKLGLNIHVIVPEGPEDALQKWVNSKATLHFENLDFPIRKPIEFQKKISVTQRLVEQIKPDLIHSHFVGTTLMLRYALGKHHPVPRIFQVPGPLHLEHIFFRKWELNSAGPKDYWIASSLYIRDIYLKAGIPENKVFKSYYGIYLPGEPLTKSFQLHEKLSIPRNYKIIGNVSHIYKPKFYLGQTKGIKRHEDLIVAIAEVTKKREDVVGVLVGGAWRGAESYEKRLRKLAQHVAPGKIHMLGHAPSSSVLSLWSDFDLAIHVPTSENCGGVVEPVLAEVPVIASNVGGIPEVIIPQETGTLVEPKNPVALAQKILENLDNLFEAKQLAIQGKKRVQELFNVLKTAREVKEIYGIILKTFLSNAVILFLMTSLTTVSWAENDPTLSLEQVFQMAKAVDPNILKAKSRIAEMSASGSLARSNYFPSIALQSTVLSNQFFLTQKIWDGGATYAASNIAHQEELIADSEKKSEVRRLYSFVAEAYYDAIFVLQKNEILKNDAKLVKNAVEYSEKQLKYRAIGKSVLMKAKIAQRKITSDLFEANSQMLRAARILSKLTRKEDFPLNSLPENLSSNTLNSFPELPSPHSLEALSRHSPDVDVLRSRDEAEIARKNFSLAEYRPQVSFILAYGFGDSTPAKSIYSTYQHGFNFGAVINIPIFSGLGSLAKERISQERREQIEQDLTSTLSNIDFETKEIINQLKQDSNDIATLEQEIKYSQKLWADVDSEYQLGLGSADVWFDALTNLETWKIQQLMKTRDYRVKSAELMASLTPDFD